MGVTHYLSSIAGAEVANELLLSGKVQLYIYIYIYMMHNHNVTMHIPLSLYNLHNR